MSENTFDKHRQFFGDQVRDFALDADLIRELERVTGTGIGMLFKRLARGDYYLSDIIEVIRLAMIGGGASPSEAAAVSVSYAARRPLSETLPLALAILECVFIGAPPADQRAPSTTRTKRKEAAR